MANKDGMKIKGPCLVVEPGEHWLKVLRVEPGRRGPAVTWAWLEQFELMDASASRALADMIKQQKAAALPVLACLPRQAVTVRLLELPSTDPAEIDDMIELQAGKQTPYSLDQVLYDYRIVGGTRAGYTRILLAIVPRDILRLRFSVLEEAGLAVEQMTVSSEGLLNWYLESVASGSGESVTALLDVDSEATDLCVMRADSLLFNRSIKSGSEALAESGDEAAERLARDVAQSLEACRNELPGTVPERIVLTGAAAGASLVPALEAALEGIAVETVDSAATASRWPAGTDLQTAPYDGLSMTSLLGMAMGPEKVAMRFVPEPVRLRRELLTRARVLSSLAALVMILLVSASLAGNLRLWRLKARFDTLDAQIKNNAPAVAAVEQQREIVMLVNQRRDPAKAAFNVIAEVYRHLLPAVYVESFAFDANRAEITIEGVVEQRANIRELITSLESSELFSGVYESGTSAMDSNRRFTFRVVCPFKGDEQ